MAEEKGKQIAALPRMKPVFSNEGDSLAWMIVRYCL
jgi:hypothetical protein